VPLYCGACGTHLVAAGDLTRNVDKRQSEYCPSSLHETLQPEYAELLAGENRGEVESVILVVIHAV
jgi:hypothetical protein